jgi:hypothetical protein
VLDIDFEKFSSLGKKGPKDPAERQALRQSDLDLWHHWNNNGRQPEHLRPLFTNFRGMIRRHVNRYVGNVEVPPAAIKQEFNERFVQALQTYQPGKGAGIGTWVDIHLKKGQRWIGAHQNIARIAEPRTQKVGDFKTAKAHLDNTLGREPTTFELSEHLGWPEREVARMQSELRKSNVASSWEIDPIDIMPSKEKEALLMVRYDLSPEELLVHDHTIGYGGKPQLRPMEIAKQLNMHPSKVSKIRGKIADKIGKLL